MAVEPDGRAYAQRLEPPWRSNLAWEAYDLSVSSSPESDWSSWFSFEALAWQPIRVEAETSMPGAGVELRLFSPDDEGTPSAVTRSDSHGRATISRLAHAGGLHYLHVRLSGHDAGVVQTAGAIQTSGVVQTYRLSVSGPYSVTSVAPEKSLHFEFEDVPLWHPYRDAIKMMTESQVLSRNTNGKRATFAPDLPVWAADFEHALDRLLGPGTRTHFLSDASASLWHAQVPTTPDRSDGNGGRTLSRAAAIRAVVETLNGSSPGALEQPPADFDSAFDDRTDALLVAEYCGLLSGLLKFSAGWNPAGLISRGETAQLVYTAMHMVRRPDVAANPAAHGSAQESPREGADTDPAGTAEGGLPARFAPDAQEALDGLMDGLVSDAVPLDAVSVEIDGSAMRAVIANMRAGRDAKKSEKADDTAGDKAAVRRPSTRVRGPARGGARESVRDRPPS